MEINTALGILLSVLGIIISVVGVGWRISTKISKLETLFIAHLEAEELRVKVQELQCSERYNVVHENNEIVRSWVKDVEAKIDNATIARARSKS